MKCWHSNECQHFLFYIDMKIVLKRIAKRDSYTIGRLYIDGVKFCDTLEDKDRGLTQSMSIEDIKSKKVYGKTAIPTGTYTVSFNYSNKFRKQLPLLNGVKGYAGVRIHSGNTANDTLGCILLGENKEVGKVLNSRITCNKFYTLVKNAIAKGDNVTITI